MQIEIDINFDYITSDIIDNGNKNYWTNLVRKERCGR